MPKRASCRLTAGGLRTPRRHHCNIHHASSRGSPRVWRRAPEVIAQRLTGAACPHAVLHCALRCSRRSGTCPAVQTSSSRLSRWQVHLAAQATRSAQADTGGKHVAYAACVIGVFAVGTALCMQEACRLPERLCCTEHYVQARASCTCDSSIHSWEPTVTVLAFSSFSL